MTDHTIVCDFRLARLRKPALLEALGDANVSLSCTHHRGKPDNTSLFLTRVFPKK
jgi:hypothetical protein